MKKIKQHEFESFINWLKTNSSDQGAVRYFGGSKDIGELYRDNKALYSKDGAGDGYLHITDVDWVDALSISSKVN